MLLVKGDSLTDLFFAGDDLDHFHMMGDCVREMDIRCMQNWAFFHLRYRGREKAAALGFVHASDV